MAAIEEKLGTRAALRPRRLLAPMSAVLQGLLRRVGAGVDPRRTMRPGVGSRRTGAPGPGRVSRSPCLQALQAAALALPGMVSLAAQAADEELVLQSHHYSEGSRDLGGFVSRYGPVKADTLLGSLSLQMTDRVKLRLGVMQDTWSGATPITTAPRTFQGNRTLAIEGGTLTSASPLILGGIYLNRALQPLVLDDSNTPTAQVDRRLVHTLSSASPETRRQGEFALGYEFGPGLVTASGGSSTERDYRSQWAGAALRLDLDQKLTTLNLALSATRNQTEAVLDHDAQPYIDTRLEAARIRRGAQGEKTLSAHSASWSASAGLAQVLDAHTQAEVNVSTTRSRGYQANPYKVMEVIFVDPGDQLFAPPDTVIGDVEALLEQRPEQRRQWTVSSRFVHHVDGSDGALHLGYRWYHDDWGITAHTVDAAWAQPLGAGWTVTPRLRYYTQEAARFYAP